jgi:hypothetical protein
MKNRIQGNLIIAVLWANLTGWINRQSRAVSAFAQISKKWRKSVMNILQKVALSKNPAGSSRKALQGAGLSGIVIKNKGVFEEIPKGVNLFLPHRKSTANQRWKRSGAVRQAQSERGAAGFVPHPGYGCPVIKNS